MCSQAQLRLALAATLPHLRLLDGQPLSPGDAMQYLAALQLQAFHPAVDAPAVTALPAPSSQGTGRRDGEHGVADSAVEAQARRKHPAALAAQPVHTLATNCEAEPLQRIRCVLASFAERPGREQQHEGQQRKMEQRPSHDADTGSSSPEQNLWQLLESCPQLADIISRALLAVQPPARLRAQPAQQQRQQEEGQQILRGTAVPHMASATQTELGEESEEAVAGASAAALAAAKAQQEQLRQEAAALQAEVAALQAELEVQTQSAQRAAQQAAEAARAAEAGAAEARRDAGAAAERVKSELRCLQVSCCQLRLPGLSCRTVRGRVVLL